MNQREDPFALDNLRVDPALAAKVGRRSKGWQRKYVQVPWPWVERLQGKGGAVYHLALLLLYEDWKQGGRPIVLSNKFSTPEGVGRRTKWYALLQLERLGLVEVERRTRKSPRIIVHNGKDQT